jgi:hypothetical protein
VQQDRAELPPDLAELIDSWAQLSLKQRAQILAIVDAARDRVAS